MAVVQWIPLAYQLTVIGVVLSMARLGDMVGRKKIYAFGFLLLSAGSVCSGLSTGLWQLIAFRVLAGLGGAVVMGNGRAIVSTVYAREGRGQAPEAVHRHLPEHVAQQGQEEGQAQTGLRCS